MHVFDKTIIVTGAGSGIGKELTLQLLRKHARVVGVDINGDALVETQKLANADDQRFKIYVLDIANMSSVQSFSKQIGESLGAVDGIINNAGIIQKFVPVNNLTIEEINRIMNVNFYGMVYMTKAFLPLLLLRSEAHIVNVSSMAGFIPFPKQTVYGAAKAAVKIFTEGLYAELKDTQVKVTVVHPGAVQTAITENSGLGKPKAIQGSSKVTLSASKAAQIIITAIEKNRYRVTVGKDAAMLDLMYRLYPKGATNFISRMMKRAQV